LIEEFNRWPTARAEEALFECFANRGWAERVAAGRPYRDLDGLMAAAYVAWAGLSDEDWLAAFAAHPRIGERGGHAPASSEREQSGVMAASSETLAALAAQNRIYEERFGHLFLIAAAGRGAAEILAELMRRMKNDAATELVEAAAELRKITRLRLERLLAQ
jgi:2-oxo-4-hydroxy-4-carboxy-5-ureidoimidazoline decarboxylase